MTGDELLAAYPARIMVWKPPEEAAPVHAMRYIEIPEQMKAPTGILTTLAARCRRDCLDIATDLAQPMFRRGRPPKSLPPHACRQTTVHSEYRRS